MTKNSLTSNKQQANRLPKTGNQSETGAVALGLATMLGMLGLAGLKRKHQ
ncbi:LPXTG cell wall anchor domain-containing protein [Limosilactobacillus portuensis]|uniref:LPXTG cell wall anchor domain-containing protein n=1 Tax=Limosilactobacillus portuensis TaxID=2742601 RepID=A0ABS6ISV0_9LACO|nr:LPXTG cell wall anchor domain-containing protein [Limosilactobacillus portuensis]MBU9694611.1 LPXTG cell wall anchor domain-containing protein [Limosilactobacillus portuensis]